MASLYIKLDVNYVDDDKILAAGEGAELLYIRCLCLVKRLNSDGFISDRQMHSIRLRRRAERITKCIDSDLLTRVESTSKYAQEHTKGQSGYLVTAWLKHNKSAAEIAEITDKRRSAGHLGGKARSKLLPDPEANENEVRTQRESTERVQTESEKRESSRPKRARKISRDWTPDDDLLSWARSEYPNLNVRSETVKFVDHFTANGKPYKDWSAAWRNWIRRADEFGKNGRAEEPERHLENVTGR